MRVLYVEDDPLLARSVELMLAREGFECQLAETGERALAYTNRERFDIIILDIMLPDIDGYEVIERLRKARVKTPILVQSGLVEPESENLSLGLAGTEFVAKPFDIVDLKGAIERAIAQDIAGDVGALPKPKITGARADGEERRKHRRFPTLKGAKVIRGNMEMDCVIMNMSHGGAALRVSRGRAECPQEFALRVDARTIRPCEVRWRFRDKVGVRFTDVAAGGQ